MTDPVRDSSAEPQGRLQGRNGPPGLPRWVLVAGIIVAALVIAAVAVMLLGGGNHGPSRHAAGQAAIEKSIHAMSGIEASWGFDRFLRVAR